MSIDLEAENDKNSENDQIFQFSNFNIYFVASLPHSDVTKSYSNFGLGALHNQIQGAWISVTSQGRGRVETSSEGDSSYTIQLKLFDDGKKVVNRPY